VKAAWEQDLHAQQIVRRAARVHVGPPPGARARVWKALEERRGRERDKPARRRLGWAMFAAGAACAAAIAVLVVPRARPTELTIQASAEAATIDLGGDGRVVAGPGTLARLQRGARGDGVVTLVLERGSLLAHIKPRATGAPFVIDTPAFRARVVGTVFRVVAREDASASIAVGHGAVEVTPRGSSPRLVRAGERWPANSTDAPSADEIARMGAADLEGAGAASFAPAARSELARPAAAPSCRALTGEDAIECWLRVADVADPVRAESALYQAGWIRMHELHDAAFALGIWERQRSRYPHGLLRDEAQTSIIDALVALRRTRAAEAEIADYLRAHPTGLRSAEMHFVRGTLQRAADGDCRRARRELDLALAHPTAPWAARARAARDGCR
jgi:FecR protein/Outer membrane lipoprotein